MSDYEIYGIGNALVDLVYQVTPGDLEALAIPRGARILADPDRQSGPTAHLEGRPVHRGAGGSAANTVIAVVQLGGRGFFTGKVADDELGHLYQADLRRNGVATNARAPAGHGRTGRCLVLVTPDAERSMCIDPGIAGDIERGDIVPEAVRASEYLYIEGYLASSDSARAAVGHARAIARAAGTKTAISLSDPGLVRDFGDGLRALIGPGVDLLFANEAEALGLTGRDSVDEALAQLAGTARCAVVTRGARGALIRQGDDVFEIPACPVDAVDTNGAGDIFAGAFMHGLTRGWSLPAAGRLATAAAARLAATWGPRLETAVMRGLLDELT